MQVPADRAVCNRPHMQSSQKRCCYDMSVSCKRLKGALQASCSCLLAYMSVLLQSFKPGSKFCRVEALRHCPASHVRGHCLCTLQCDLSLHTPSCKPRCKPQAFLPETAPGHKVIKRRCSRRAGQWTRPSRGNWGPCPSTPTCCSCIRTAAGATLTRLTSEWGS